MERNPSTKMTEVVSTRYLESLIRESDIGISKYSNKELEDELSFRKERSDLLMEEMINDVYKNEVNINGYTTNDIVVIYEWDVDYTSVGPTLLVSFYIEDKNRQERLLCFYYDQDEIYELFGFVKNADDNFDHIKRTVYGLMIPYTMRLPESCENCYEFNKSKSNIKEVVVEEMKKFYRKIGITKFDEVLN